MFCQLLKISQQNCQVIIFEGRQQKCIILFGGRKILSKHHSAYQWHPTTLRMQRRLNALHTLLKVMNTLLCSFASDHNIRIHHQVETRFRFGSLNILQVAVVLSLGQHDLQTLSNAISFSGALSKIVVLVAFSLRLQS